MKRTLAICLLSLVSRSALAQERDGQVQIPLALYNQLIETTRTPTQRPAPLNFALGNAAVRVRVRPHATISLGR